MNIGVCGRRRVGLHQLKLSGLRKNTPNPAPTSLLSPSWGTQTTRSSPLPPSVQKSIRLRSYAHILLFKNWWLLEMDGGDDRTTLWMYLKPLNYEHKNGTMAKKINDPKYRWFILIFLTFSAHLLSKSLLGIFLQSLVGCISKECWKCNIRCPLCFMSGKNQFCSWEQPASKEYPQGCWKLIFMF